MKRIHAASFEAGTVEHVEVTSLVTESWKTLEIELKRQFGLLGGPPLPRWVRRQGSR